jgi:hypothetical protein
LSFFIFQHLLRGFCEHFRRVNQDTRVDFDHSAIKEHFWVEPGESKKSCWTRSCRMDPRECPRWSLSWHPPCWLPSRPDSRRLCRFKWLLRTWRREMCFTLLQTLLWKRSFAPDGALDHSAFIEAWKSIDD